MAQRRERLGNIKRRTTLELPDGFREQPLLFIPFESPRGERSAQAQIDRNGGEEQAAEPAGLSERQHQLRGPGRLTPLPVGPQ